MPNLNGNATQRQQLKLILQILVSHQADASNDRKTICIKERNKHKRKTFFKGLRGK